MELTVRGGVKKVIVKNASNIDVTFDDGGSQVLIAVDYKKVVILLEAGKDIAVAREEVRATASFEELGFEGGKEGGETEL